MVEMKTGMEKIFVIATVLAALVCIAGIAMAEVSDYGTLTQISSTSFIPQTIQPGDTISMVVAVQDRGTSTDIVNLKASLDLDNQFVPVSTTDSIDIIKAGATKNLVFKFRAMNTVPPGYYHTLLNMTYTNNGNPVTESINIPVPVSSTQKNIEVSISPKTIDPGNQTDMVFTLKNVGGTPISNIAFSWSEKSSLILPLGTDNRAYVDSLNAGESHDIKYIVAADPNIAPGIYSLNVTITFTDFNGLETQNSQVGLIIGGGTDFEASGELGQNGQISLSIANIGSNNAGAVVVSIPPQPGFAIAGSSSAIIGNLNKGDFSLANFTFRQGDTNGTGGMFRYRASNPGQGQDAQQGTQASGQGGFGSGPRGNSLKLDISYTDTTGVRQTVEKTIQFNPPAQGAGFARNAQQDSYPLYAAALLVLFLIGSYIYNQQKAKMEMGKLWPRLALTAVLFIAAILLFNSSTLSIAVAAVLSLAGLATLFMEKTKK